MRLIERSIYLDRIKSKRGTPDIKIITGIRRAGKSSKRHKHMGLHFKKPKNKIEELELEIMKKDIEIARLKKGYNVKGVGQEKEFVTTFNKNIK